jgi:hypothetical protein
MATTVQDILNGAYGKSAKNRPLSLAADATELVKVVQRSLQGLFAYGTRINPLFFGTSADVNAVSGSWARPADAESIFRIEIVAGLVEVAVVPFDDRKKAEPTMPAVYEMGQKFLPVGNVNDPVGTLRIWYARQASALVNLTDVLDAMWPERFNELLELEVAIYLALKDGRDSEVAELRPPRDAWAALYGAHLEHATANLRARFAQVRRFATNTLIPIQGILAGGSPTT